MSDTNYLPDPPSRMCAGLVLFQRLEADRHKCQSSDDGTGVSQLVVSGPVQVPWYGQVPHGPFNLGPLEGPRLQRTIPFGGCPLLSCSLAGLGRGLLLLRWIFSLDTLAC